MDLLAEHISVPPGRNGLTDAEIDEQVDCLSSLGADAQSARNLLPAATALIRAAPADPRPQLLAATLMERARMRENMTDTWEALFDRFPHLNTALRYWLRWLNREGRTDEAVALLQRLFDDAGQSDEDLAEQAEMYGEIRDPAASDRLFGQLIARFPANVRLRVLYGKALFSRGEILRAFAVLDPVRGENLSATAQAVMERNDRAILAMETIRPKSAALRPSGTEALVNAVSLFARRTPRRAATDRINGLVFYTGSLGAGGAERQLTQMAQMTHARARSGRRVNGVAIDGQVEVIVNSLDSGRGKDFFANALAESGVKLTAMRSIRPLPLDVTAPGLEILEDLAPILPQHVRFGLDHLVPHLAEAQPDVAYIWQDGAVLTGALAALVAGVPRIAISLRGLPPNLRPHLMKPEYHSLYRSLARVPGVSFACNSATAARAYCDWLRLPADTFSVLPNAVRPLPSQGEERDRALWAGFERSTRGARFTLGGIFRFSANKRGLMWVEMAARALARQPALRFVLVGDGDEWAAAKSRATALGIDRQILFVGRSNAPGFWHSKFDALALLSENEGLPNVLIEAQVAGKPVISTPAGGAAETFVDGQTGHLLRSASAPDVEEIVARVCALAADPAKCRTMGLRAAEAAERRFSPDRILSQTVRHLLGARVTEQMPAPEANITPIPRRPAPPVAGAQVRDAYNIFTGS